LSQEKHILLLKRYLLFIDYGDKKQFISKFSIKARFISSQITFSKQKSVNLKRLLVRLTDQSSAPILPYV